MTTAVTSLSSKGQIVIPQNIRKELNIETGAKLFVVSDGSNLLIKPIEPINPSFIKKLFEESEKIRIEKKINKSDIQKLIKKSRNESGN